MLWGFGRSVGHELDETRVRLVDLDPGAAIEVPVLAEELLFPDREEEIAYRSGIRQAPRLVRLEGAVRGSTGFRRLRSDRSYLVTGGLGGIGLLMARWLVERGAGAVVLNGRRPPDPSANEAISELRASGTPVRVEIADVADAEAVAGMVASIEEAESRRWVDWSTVRERSPIGRLPIRLAEL